MNIFVTGATGFLGAHLVASFLADGHSVTGLDNFYSSDQSKLTWFSGNFSFLNEDVQKLDRHKEIMNQRFDLICNLACPASPPIYQRDQKFTLETSVIGIQKCIDLALRDNAILFHASTSEVYGDPDRSIQSEHYWGNVNPYGERSCYDEGKRVAETSLFIAHKYYGLQTRIARIFNTYGPGMDPNDGRVVSNFITQALRGEPLTIYGSGNQTRSLCYVDDMIHGFRKLIYSNCNSPVNLGNPVEYTVHEIADLVIKLAGSKSKTVYNPLPADDPKQRCPDITKAEDTLDWGPQIGLVNGLERTINYFSGEVL